MLNRTKRSCRAAAVAAVIGLGAATGSVPLLVAPAAVAQDIPKSLVDSTKKGSITVHKRQLDTAPEDNGNNTGKELSKAPGNDLEEGQSATFTITKLKADLTTNAGLKEARSLTVGDRNNGEKIDKNFGTDGVSAPKSADKTTQSVTFDSLPLGVYVVEETAVEGGLVPADPFLVFVPMTASGSGTERTEWNYDVHVYPKNSKVSVDKSVQDSEGTKDGGNHKLYQPGDTLTYTLTGDVPQAGNVTTYVLTDTITPEFVDLSSFSVTSVTLPDGTTADKTSYEVSSTSSEGVTTIRFTDFAALNNAVQTHKDSPSSGDGKVTAKVQVTLNNSFGGKSDLTNKVKLTTTTGGNSETDTPEEEVHTYFTNLQVVKSEAGKPDQKVEGAKFQLHYCTTVSGKEQLYPDNSAGAISIGGVDSWTTNNNGELLIEGIHVTDYKNNSEVTDGDPHYCLVETEAPADYELLTEPVKVEDLVRKGEDDSGLVDVTKADETTVKAVRKEVENVKATRPELPLTGGKGISAILALGAAVMGAGFLYARRNTRRA